MDNRLDFASGAFVHDNLLPRNVQSIAGIPLLPSRLSIPPLPTGLVERVDLMALLEKGLDAQLILMSAPAGFGKTTTVAAWLASRSSTGGSLPVAWYTVDRFDSDLRTFCAYLVAALRTVHADVASTTWQTLQAAQLPVPEGLADLLVEELSTLPGNTILVIDDYQGISHPDVHAFFSRLLNQVPRGLRVVLLTRVHPPFSLARLRAQRRLAWINAGQLRFNLAESKDLLSACLGHPVEDAVAASIHQAVEGWGAALILFAAVIRDGVDLALAQQKVLDQGINYLFDYLADEVLAGQTDEVEEFMLRTSILEIFNAELCAAVWPACTLAGARTFLLQLEQANLLLQAIDTSHGWYRYHSLLKTVLQQRMREILSPDEVYAGYCRAAQYMARTGDLEQALSYYLAVGAMEEAANTLESAIPDLENREQWIGLERWLQRLPAELVKGRPGLLLASAWVYNFHFQYAAMRTYIDQAAALLDADPTVTDPAHERVLRGEMEAFYTTEQMAVATPAERIEHGVKALALLPADRKFVRGFVLHHMADAYRSLGEWQVSVRLLEDSIQSGNLQSVRLLHALSVTYGYTGELRRANQAALLYYYYAKQADLPMSVAWAQSILGVLAFEQNQIAEATAYHKQVIAVRHAASYLTLILSLQNLILIADTESEYIWLQQELNRVREDLMRMGNYEAFPSLDALTALLWLRQGDLARAWGWAQIANPTERLHGTIPVIETTYIRVMLAQGTASALAQGQRVADHLAALCRQIHIFWHLAEVLVLQAILAYAQGNLDQAFDHLSEVIARAIPLGFRRIFLQEGPSLSKLLAHFLATANKSTAPEGWRASAQLLLQSDLLATSSLNFASSGADRALAPAHLCSDRELEILHLLAQDLSNKEIAHKLHLSPHTVRNHLVNIFDKLGVNSRTEALLRARELGILASV